MSADRVGGGVRGGRGRRLAPATAFALLAAVVLPACAGGFLGSRNSFERAFESGRYESAMATFARDSSLHTEEEPLFRAGLLRATPDRPFYDPDRARMLLSRLLDLHPDTDFRAYAEGLLSLLDRMEATSSRVASLQEELAETEARNDSLREALLETGVRVDSLEEELAAAEGLEEELEAALSRAARLEKQLEQLKQVHLQQPPDTGTGGSRR